MGHYCEPWGRGHSKSRDNEGAAFGVRDEDGVQMNDALIDS